MTNSLWRTGIVTVAAIAAAVAFAWFVWPTRYIYDHLRIDGFGDYPVRIDRITGRTEILRNFQGWQLAQPSPPTPAPVAAAPNLNGPNAAHDPLYDLFTPQELAAMNHAAPASRPYTWDQLFNTAQPAKLPAPPAANAPQSP